jgi:hypothetical protein
MAIVIEVIAGGPRNGRGGFAVPARPQLRARPGCTAIAELDRTWHIPPDEFGHYCLLAQVECPLYTAVGSLVPNVDRHVGQRNVEILAGEATPIKLINVLGGLVPERFTPESTHAGPAVRGHLQAWGGGALPDAAGNPRAVTAPELKDLRVGVTTSTSRHLLTAFAVSDEPLGESLARPGRGQKADR